MWSSPEHFHLLLTPYHIQAYVGMWLGVRSYTETSQENVVYLDYVCWRLKAQIAIKPNQLTSVKLITTTAEKNVDAIYYLKLKIFSSCLTVKAKQKLISPSLKGFYCKTAMGSVELALTAQ